jgi:hypothetical protein
MTYESQQPLSGEEKKVKRATFYEDFVAGLEGGETFDTHLAFSDEATFHLCWRSHATRQKCVYDPFSSESTATGIKFLDMLQM